MSSGVRDANGRDLDWRQVGKDLRLWFGIAAGMAAAFGGVLIGGRDVLKAPEVAAQARDTANAALRMSRDNREWQGEWAKTLRLTFCTSPSFNLSRTARASLKCYLVETGAPPDGVP